MTFAKRIEILTAWALAAAVVFVTLGPLGDRPRTGHPQLDRFVAYFVLVVAFCVAYPRRVRLVGAFAVVAAILLEIGQIFLSYRHAHVIDGAVKIAGGLCGVAFWVVAARLVQGPAPGPRPPRQTGAKRGA